MCPLNVDVCPLNVDVCLLNVDVCPKCWCVSTKCWCVSTVGEGVEIAVFMKTDENYVFFIGNYVDEILQ